MRDSAASMQPYDLQRVERQLLATSIYIYKRVGFDQRVLQFLEQGLIGVGSARCEVAYELSQQGERFYLSIYDSDRSVTCILLLAEDGIWRGRWLHFEQMEIELAPMPEPYINGVEFRLASLKRSGHHGFLNWLFRQCPGTSICFLNNAVPNANPFMTQNFSHLEQYRLEDHYDLLAEAGGRLTIKDYLIYCYEDWPLDHVFSDRFERYHDHLVGASSVRYDLVILRDPFNCFASRLKQWWQGWMHEQFPALNTPAGREECVRLWKAFANEYLRKTAYRKHTPVDVNYNRWFTDRAYRQALAASLGLPFPDSGMNKVMYHGAGSSFDGLAFDGNAQNMRVLERWQQYRDNPLYLSLFRHDTELLDLASEIFPDMFHEVQAALKL